MSELTPGASGSARPEKSDQRDGSEGPQPGAHEPPPRQTGRNEPCPCGSGKKYKRCHGVGAAPKLTPPKPRADASPSLEQGQGPGFPQLNPEMLANLDPSKVQMPPGLEGVTPEMMSQVAQMLQRLPKGQLQRLQGIMQRAMAGKDVTREAQEFEKTLPAEFQQMLGGFQLPAMAGLPAAGGGEMTPEQAREIVARAAAEGKISSEQAQALLSTSQADKTSGSSSS